MKITFITTFFTGATLPFIKHLQEKGHECDLYIFAKQGCSNLETLDFDAPVSGLQIQTISKGNGIYRYLDTSVNISIVPFLPVRNRKYLIGFISYFKNLFVIQKLLNIIAYSQSDVIYVIVNEEHDAILAKELKRKRYENVIIAYHEVVKSHFGKPELKDAVKATCNLGYPLITYSEGTKDKLKQLTHNSKINKLYFGPFETFQLHNTEDIVKEEYILFIGHITPYKGLSFLYETIKKYYDKINCKVVIAGGGYDSCLDSIRNDNKYIVINRFLKDSEFASLVKHAKVIICPYVNGSQSGITHVAMIYGIPVIATKVGAFPEFIENGKNGLLVDYGNHEQLFNAITHYTGHIYNEKYEIPRMLLWENIINDFETIIQNN